MKKYVITYDIGTTGIKTCLIEIEDSMRILASATAGYNLYVDDETAPVYLRYLRSFVISAPAIWTP